MLAHWLGMRPRERDTWQPEQENVAASEAVRGRRIDVPTLAELIDIHANTEGAISESVALSNQDTSIVTSLLGVRRS